MSFSSDLYVGYEVMKIMYASILPTYNPSVPGHILSSPYLNGPDNDATSNIIQS